MPTKGASEPRFEEELCFDCGGSGYDSSVRGNCETCAGTGRLYTQEAIRLQLEARDRDN